jgi:hypothetical protein
MAAEKRAPYFAMATKTMMLNYAQTARQTAAAPGPVQPPQVIFFDF